MSPNRPELLLAVPPSSYQSACVHGLPVAHMAYRMGAGCHLLRANIPVAARGGLMVIADTEYDGRGDHAVFCREVIRECNARNFDGVICAFSHAPTQLLGRVVTELGELTARRSWPLYVPEAYARFSPKAHVIIPSALSGGSLSRRLQEAAARYGAEQLILGVQRVAEDFFLPAPTGGGTPLSREELRRRMEERAPSIFFSDELCARYFTYMSRENGAHFILFDDAGSIRRKLYLAREIGIRQAILSYQDVDDLLPDLLP